MKKACDRQGVFFNLPDELAVAGKTSGNRTIKDVRRQLRSAVLDSVRHHLVADVPLGVLEYGGSYEGACVLRRSLFMPWELADILDEEIVRED